MPAVSVITPAFNTAPFLAETVESVLAQRFQDWELVIVDDGSTDDTAEIAQRYADRDARIRIVRQENRGLAAARNTAVHAARGEFCALLDSDDVWLPGFLGSQMEVFARHPDTALVTGNAHYMGGPRNGEPVRPIVGGTPVIPVEEMLVNECAVFVMTTFRRAVFHAIGGFDPSKRRSEDWDFWIRAALAGFIMRRNPSPLAAYRVREGSLSQDARSMLKEMLHTLSKAAPACRPGTTAHAALAFQINRLECELLRTEAKLALQEHDFARAAANLRELRQRGAGVAVGLTAWLAEHAPAGALLAFRMRHLRQYALRVTRRDRGGHAESAAS